MNSKSLIKGDDDPVLKALKIELKQLELELGRKTYELSDIEKMIHNFDVRQSKELGGILEQILKLKKERLLKEKNVNAEKQKDYEKAKFEYEEFEKQLERSKDDILHELSDSQKKELKKLYREASKLCHPDIVPKVQKDHAEEIFKNLCKAYEENDIEKVRFIYDSLINGNFLLKKSDAINEVTLLELEIAKLKKALEEIDKKINGLKLSEGYRFISQIDNFDQYFEKTKNDLLEELEYLKRNEQYG